jgi:predicted Zn-dependent protease
MRRPILLLAAGAVALGPAAAQGPRYLDPRDVQLAQREHAAMVQEFGGAETGPRAAYVQAVGQRVGNFSGIASPGQTLHYTLLNSPVENALSVPGGYVYITRQLMTLMDDESQLAFALGHETGHIAANHAHAREQYAQRDIFGVLGQIVGSVFGVGGIGSMISQQSALRTLSFSRDQEYQADSLGLRYITAAGYNPAGGPGILAALARSSALEARVQGRTNRQTPEWASTHPLSENRSVRALQEARATGRLGRGILNRDVFLAQLNGVYVDDDPAQGVIEGRTFTHPDLRIQFAVPPGYLMSNGTTAVTIKGSAGQAQFSGGRYSGSLDDYILLVIRQLTGGQMQFAVPPPQRTTINGMPVAMTTARVNGRSGVVDVSVVAYQWDRDRVYHFVMVTQGGSQLGPFGQMVGSLRRISPAEAAAIRPRVIDVVTIRPGDTVQTLASRMAYRDFQLDRFLALNGLAANTRLAAGQKVKLVVYGPRRAETS